MTATQSIPLRTRLEGGGTPKMTGRWQIKSETGPLKDVLLGPAESFRWMGLENAAWSSLVRDTLRLQSVAPYRATADAQLAPHP